MRSAKHKQRRVTVDRRDSKVKPDDPKKRSHARLSYAATIKEEISRAIEQRELLKVIETIDGVEVDSTPKIIQSSRQVDRFSKLRDRLDSNLTLHSMIGISTGGSYLTLRSGHSSYSTATRMMGNAKLSLDELIAGVGSVTTMGREESLSSELASIDLEQEAALYMKLPAPYTKKFVKVKLRKTAPILLYEQRSFTAARGTEEAQEVEADNKHYDYLTVGKGKIRRRSEIDAQTVEVLRKSRHVNTNYVKTADQSTYVSNFDMYDTFQYVKLHMDSAEMPDLTNAGKVVPTRRLLLAEQYRIIVRKKNYQLASMIIKRLLAGNEFAAEQQRFRNMNPVTRMSKEVNFRYSLNVLFRSGLTWKEGERKAVADISFCKGNGDIYAVAYGLFSMTSNYVPSSGLLSIWSIKNPCDPERSYKLASPAESVNFSPFEPSLLAVGMFDGTVAVYDISSPASSPLAVSKRSSELGCDPMVSIKFIKMVMESDSTEIDPFIVLSQDGTVYKFRLNNSPYLTIFKQMILERVEGDPEGLTVHIRERVSQQANRHPQGLSLAKHPTIVDLYYVLTDEGCIYKCSTNYPHQYLQLLKTHDGSVNLMDFSPWSPKLFLTCGNDWCIRIWLDGIFKPLITLRYQMAPIHAAFWSRTNSTVIVALNRRTCDIWDLNKNILNPVASHELDSSFNTMAKFSSDGRCIAIGNERGTVIMCAIDDMPFSPHFQYDELEKAIYKATADFPDLMFDLKTVGYFGYPNQGFVKLTS